MPVHLLDDFTPDDPPHGWDACHDQWNNGANDGFVRAHAGASARPTSWAITCATQIPVTYALADAGAVCDRWFAGCMGPTWPNRFYLHGATSNGGTRPTCPALRLHAASSTGSTTPASSHTNYFHDVAWATGGYGKLTGLRTIERFFERRRRRHPAADSR